MRTLSDDRYQNRQQKIRSFCFLLSAAASSGSYYIRLLPLTPPAPFPSAVQEMRFAASFLAEGSRDPPVAADRFPIEMTRVTSENRQSKFNQNQPRTFYELNKESLLSFICWEGNKWLTLAIRPKSQDSFHF
jgi:hypothetical protein